MALTLAEMRARVAANIGSTPAAYTFIDRYLNDGQLDLGKDSVKLKRANVSVVADSFSLPADCLFMRAVAWTVKELLPWPGEVLPVDGSGAALSGTPSYYMQFGPTVYVTPAKAGTCQLTYTARPAEMTATSSKADLADADDALIAYATWMYFHEDTDYSPAQAEYWRQEYIAKKVDWLDLDRKVNYRLVGVADRLRGWWG